MKNVFMYYWEMIHKYEKKFITSLNNVFPMSNKTQTSTHCSPPTYPSFRSDRWENGLRMSHLGLLPLLYSGPSPCKAATRLRMKAQPRWKIPVSFSQEPSQSMDVLGLFLCLLAAPFGEHTRSQERDLGMFWFWLRQFSLLAGDLSRCICSS
jgi:hypothetical protein